MSKQKNTKNHSKAWLVTVIFLAVALTAGAAYALKAYQRNRRFDLVRADIKNVIQDLSSNGLNAEFVEGQGKAQAKYDTGPEYHFLGLEEKNVPSNDGHAIIFQNVQQVIFNNGFSTDETEGFEHSGTTQKKYTHLETGMQCSAVYEIKQLSADSTPSNRLRYQFSCHE